MLEKNYKNEHQEVVPLVIQGSIIKHVPNEGTTRAPSPHNACRRFCPKASANTAASKLPEIKDLMFGRLASCNHESSHRNHTLLRMPCVQVAKYVAPSMGHHFQGEDRLQLVHHACVGDSTKPRLL